MYLIDRAQNVDALWKTSLHRTCITEADDQVSDRFEYASEFAQHGSQVRPEINGMSRKDTLECGVSIWQVGSLTLVNPYLLLCYEFAVVPDSQSDHRLGWIDANHTSR
jgi:hypothetical protein